MCSGSRGSRPWRRPTRYLRDVYVPRHNATFRRAPRDPPSAFVPLGAVDLDTILCQEDARVVAPDNTVVVGGQVLQIARQPGRRTCAGLRVLVRQHLDGTRTITRPPDVRLGSFGPDGRPLTAKRVPDPGESTTRPRNRPQEQQHPQITVVLHWVEERQRLVPTP